jgi:uncharacterized protein Usg
MVDVPTLLEGSFWKTYRFWDNFPQLLKYQDFQSIGIWIEGIILYFKPVVRFHHKLHFGAQWTTVSETSILE